MAKKEEYNPLVDRDLLATLRTIEEVISLPKYLAEPLNERLKATKE